VALGTTTADAQSFVFRRFTPEVIRSDRVDLILFEFKFSGPPGRVFLEFQPGSLSPTDIELLDDGTGGDRVTGDGIFSAMLDPQPIVNALQPDDVFRVFVGFVRMEGGSGRVNIFIDVITDAVPRPPVTQLSPAVQHTDHLVNIVDPAFVQNSSNLFSGDDVRRVAHTFYSFFPDRFDFLNIISGISHFGNRFHITVQNNVSGTGVGSRDTSSEFGSAGTLLGYQAFPIPGFFDGAGVGYQHEMGHQWINFLQAEGLGSGIPHWPASSLASSIIGFSPGGGQGLEFPCLLVPDESSGGILLLRRTEEPVYSDLSLYLMGLIPPEEVGIHYVFADQSFSSQNCSGTISESELIQVDIQNVIGVVGVRVPDSSNSPRRFRLATILVTDQPADENKMALYSFFAARAEGQIETPTHSGFSKGIGKPFAISTGRRGALDAHLSIPLPVAGTLTPDNVQEGSGGLILTVTGEDFTPTSVVRWSSSDRPTTFVSSTELRADIPASDLASAGRAQVSVFNPDRGGGDSNSIPFTVVSGAGNPVPAISALSPASVVVGADSFTLVVSGSDFVGGAKVRWNGVDRTTTVVSSTHVRGAIPASQLTTAGTAEVTVFNPAPGGGASNAVNLGIVDFAVEASPANATVTAGQLATYEITVSSLGGPLNAEVSLSCASVPALSACSFFPATVIPGANPAKSTLTITTTAPSTAIPSSPLVRPVAPGVVLYFAVAALAFLLLLLRTGISRKHAWLPAAIAAGLFLLLVGCGGENGIRNPGTPLGTHAITINAQTGSVTHTTQISLTVQ
jgi:hypothetical protein